MFFILETWFFYSNLTFSVVHQVRQVTCQTREAIISQIIDNLLFRQQYIHTNLERQIRFDTATLAFHLLDFWTFGSIRQQYIHTNLERQIRFDTATLAFHLLDFGTFGFNPLQTRNANLCSLSFHIIYLPRQSI